MKNLFNLIALFLLTSCVDQEVETSGTLTEKAMVVTLIHSPSEHKTEITRTMHTHSSLLDEEDNDLLGIASTGVDYEGNSGIKISKNHQLTTTTIPEKFGVAFQCSHGTFTIEGSETKHKVLYDKLYRNVGDTVTILYKEEYLLTYETENKVRKLVKRELRRLDFIDAQK